MSQCSRDSLSSSDVENVESWTVERMRAWSLNLTQEVLPEVHWHERQVAAWAQRVLKFSEESAQILIAQGIDGDTLLDPPVRSLADLVALLPGIPTGKTKKMWNVIELLAQPSTVQLQNLTFDALSYSRQDVQKDNEAVMEIQLLMSSVKITNTSASATNDDKMPFKDREREAEVLKRSVACNLLAYKGNSRRKNDYYFTVVTSGTGFGKTRFCKEIPNLIKSIPGLPSTMVTIHLDLSVGDRVLNWHMERDDYRQNKKSYLENLVGRRMAAHALWNCNFCELLGALEYEGKVDSLDLLTFDGVLKTIGQKLGGTSAQPVGVLLILDEINYLFKYDKIAGAVIEMIGNYMTNNTSSLQRDAGVVLFPIISGTAVNGVAESFLSSAFGKEFIPLGLLTLQSAKDIFAHCLPTKKHWLNDKRVIRLLLLYGNTPVVLRRINAILQEKGDTLTTRTFDSLIEQLEGEVSASRFKLPNLDVTHVDIVLAGVKTDSTPSISFQKLEDDGVVYVLDDRYMLPYVYLRAANRHFESVPPKLLPTPGVEFSWSDFEKLEHVLQGVRINVLLEFMDKSTEIKLNKLFQGAKFVKSEAIVRLRHPIAVTCSDKLLIKKDDLLDLQSITVTMEDKTAFVTTAANYFEYSFLAAPGNALFDIVEFYRSTSDKYVVVFKQMKHLEDSENQKTIGPKSIKEWVQQMRDSTRNLIGYLCYFMLITNKRIPSAKSLVAKYPDLVIVDQTNLIDYYGPTVATFADLVSLDDAVATNSEN